MKRYAGEHIAVTYDTARCLHAAECVRGMPAVFDTAKRPWIAPDAGDAEELAAVIRRCPTGALHYTLREGEPERPYCDRSGQCRQWEYEPEPPA